MEFLKDKKNLRIVVALAVFFLLGAGGLIAFELGAFSGGSTAAVPTPAAAPGGLPASGRPPMPITGGAPVSRPPGMMPMRGMPPGMSPGMPRGVSGAPAPAAAAAAKKPDVVNPAVGPDPFNIPGGAKKVAENGPNAANVKLPLREVVGPLNLFQLHPPAPPVTPVIDGGGSGGGLTGPSPAANYRLSGVITGSDGINAILDVNGQSQSVKPGDALPDGTRVQNIQTNSITLRTAGGSVITLPLSAGTPDQGTGGFNGPAEPNSQFQPGFQPGFNPQGQGTNNQ